MKWRLFITPKVQAALRTFPPETKRYIREAFGEICRNPWVGKPLRDELEGFHSFRAKRFRIVYQIRRHEITVAVIAVGPRETIYEELTAERSSRRAT
ncbi:MAG: type II toxin-antitoxin system RelE/ParE family toxin [Candidatus Omnitrophica bacterium]|nr:type II toxin-antitoxin system RelE/ParE family toxin [Candidatus Omnitrophota bacterium]